MDKIDTYSHDKIICPYCGHEEEWTLRHSFQPTWNVRRNSLVGNVERIHCNKRGNHDL